MKVKYIKLRENAVVPVYATECSAGADLSACIDEDYNLKPGEIKMFPTGISIEPECSDCVCLVFGRSGLGCKHGITLANSVGVIDSDYRGEIMVTLINRSEEEYTVKAGERIAQLVVMPCLHCTFEEAETLENTERGRGGFGSTGR